MSPERQQPRELTAEQLETASFLLEACGLEDYADETLEMMGDSGSVRYGLGRCAEYLLDRTPDQIRDMVLAKLEQQKLGGASGYSA